MVGQNSWRVLGGLGAWVALSLAACETPPDTADHDPIPAPLTQPDNVADYPAGADRLGVPDDQHPPQVSIESPGDGAVIEAPTVDLVIATEDDTAVVALSVSVNNGSPVFADFRAGFDRLSVSVALPLGSSRLQVVAYDAAGNQGIAELGLTRTGATDDGEPPSVEITSPPPETLLAAVETIAIAGTASDNTDVIRVDVDNLDVANSARTALTSDGFATWESQLPVAAGQNRLAARAVDASGYTTSSIVTVTVGAVDDTPPTITITSPVQAVTVGEFRSPVSGTATDNVGVTDIRLQVNDGPFVSAEALSASFVFTAWSHAVTLVPGDNLVRVLAYDAAGNTATAEVTLAYDPGSEWSAPHYHELTWAPRELVDVTLTLNRDKLAEAVPLDEAADITLVTLDPAPLLAAAVDSLAAACVAGDVSTCPAAWGESELNMWRLITMTPASANVVGTSFEAMAEIAQWLADNPVDGGPELSGLGEMLSIALATPLDEALIPAAAVTDAIRTNVVRTHPNASSGVFDVTLADALTNMATFGARYGPLGAHPGFVDPAGGVFSQVLLDTFAMTVTGASNLHWHDGLDLNGGPFGVPQKGKLAFLATGETDVLELDFSSQDAFTLTGIDAAPTVDLDFQMVEHDGWVTAAELTGDVCSMFDGNSAAPWTDPVAPWTIEAVVACAAKNRFADFRAGCDLCDASTGEALLWGIYPEDSPLSVDLFELVVGRVGHSRDGGLTSAYFPNIAAAPAGWMRLWTIQQNGYPSSVTTDHWDIGYLWHLLTEVAQRRLQDGGIAEGEGDVRFALTDLPVGITEAQLLDEITSSLESQKSRLSQVMLGTYWELSDRPDVFLARTTDGTLVLAHTQPGDPAVHAHDAGAELYGDPHFYSDPALTTVASYEAALDVASGLHHVVVAGGERLVVYTRGRSGSRHRLELERLDVNTVAVWHQRGLEVSP